MIYISSSSGKHVAWSWTVVPQVLHLTFLTFFSPSTLAQRLSRSSWLWWINSKGVMQFTVFLQASSWYDPKAKVSWSKSFKMPCFQDSLSVLGPWSSSHSWGWRCLMLFSERKSLTSNYIYIKMKPKTFVTRERMRMSFWFVEWGVVVFWGLFFCCSANLIVICSHVIVYVFFLLLWGFWVRADDDKRREEKRSGGGGVS